MGNKGIGCGKFKLSCSCVGGWCGITKRAWGKDVIYCKECIKKFADSYKKIQSIKEKK